MKSKVPKVKLNNGELMPSIAFGTYEIKNKQECIKSVLEAIELGYRHIDTAQVYKNEQFVGEAIKKSGVRREELFVTTKIHVGNFLKVQKSFDESLEKLDTDYVDLLLLHFPVTGLRKNAWKNLEDIYKSGAARSIGVSNYTTRHLKSLFKYAEITPAVNQVELHVYLQQPELLEYCDEKGIAVEAYSPLARAHDFDNPILKKLAKKYNKSSAQIMLRWCVEVGAIPLPKSVTPSRIKQNIDIFDFELEPTEIKDMQNLNKDLHTCWDPTKAP